MFPTYVAGTANHARTCFTTVHAGDPEHPPRFAILARVTTLHDPFATLSLSLSPPAVAPFALKSGPPLPPLIFLFTKRWSCILYLDLWMFRFDFLFFFKLCLSFVFIFDDRFIPIWSFSFSFFFFSFENLCHVNYIILGKISLDRLKCFILIRFKKRKMEND